MLLSKKNPPQHILMYFHVRVYFQDSDADSGCLNHRFFEGCLTHVLDCLWQAFFCGGYHNSTGSENKEYPSGTLIRS